MMSSESDSIRNMASPSGHPGLVPDAAGRVQIRVFKSMRTQTCRYTPRKFGRGIVITVGLNTVPAQPDQAVSGTSNLAAPDASRAFHRRRALMRTLATTSRYSLGDHAVPSMRFSGISKPSLDTRVFCCLGVFLYNTFQAGDRKSNTMRLLSS